METDITKQTEADIAYMQLIGLGIKLMTAAFILAVAAIIVCAVVCL